MATTFKILGKVKPNATTNTTLYTVPASTQAVVNVKIANQSSTASAIRIAVVLSGGSVAATDYMIYDYTLEGNQTLEMSGIALNAGEFIVTYTANNTVSFVATGVEKT